MAAAEVIFTNFLLVNDELFFMILIVLICMIGIPTFHKCIFCKLSPRMNY